jgi:hypothetical protein
MDVNTTCVYGFCEVGSWDPCPNPEGPASQKRSNKLKARYPDERMPHRPIETLITHALKRNTPLNLWDIRPSLIIRLRRLDSFQLLYFLLAALREEVVNDILVRTRRDAERVEAKFKKYLSEKDVSIFFL